MILLNHKALTATKAAQYIIWLYGAQWSSIALKSAGLDVDQLTSDERAELIEQLEKQEHRVKALFGL